MSQNKFMYVRITGQLVMKKSEKKAAIDLVSHLLYLEEFLNRIFHKYQFHLFPTFKNGRQIVADTVVPVRNRKVIKKLLELLECVGLALKGLNRSSESSL